MHLAVILNSLRLLMLDQSEVFRVFFVVGCFSCIVVPFRILGFSFVPVVLFLYAVFFVHLSFYLHLVRFVIGMWSTSQYLIQML